MDLPQNPDNHLTFSCLRCGKCCHEIPERMPGIYKRIPLYPEEADRLESLARERNVPLKMIEDLVFPDIKNKKILVLTWRIILEPEGVCPFFDEKIGCTINENKPLACRAYPLAIKRVDAFNMKIDIDPLCSFTELHRAKLEHLDFSAVMKIYEKEYFWARKMLRRNQKAIIKIRAMEYSNEIEIPRKITPKEYNKMLKDWDRTIITEDWMDEDAE